MSELTFIVCGCLLEEPGCCMCQSGSLHCQLPAGAITSLLHPLQGLPMLQYEVADVR